MVKYEDECVGCSDLGLSCLGSTCPNRNVPHFYCDDCGEEYSPDELYTDPNSEDVYCKDCILSKLETLADKL